MPGDGRSYRDVDHAAQPQEPRGQGLGDRRGSQTGKAAFERDRLKVESVVSYCGGRSIWGGMPWDGLARKHR